MAISRPFLLALLGAVLLGASFFAVQNARDAATDDASSTAPQGAPQQESATPAAQTLTPEQTLDAAFALGGIDSTAFNADLSFGGQGQSLNLDLSGAYEKGAPNDVPEVEVDVKLTTASGDAEGGFVSLGDRAFFTQGDTGWRVPDEVWQPLVDSVAKGGAEQLLALPVDPQQWVRDVKSEGTETIDGVETTHVSASIDPARALKDLARVARQSGTPVPNPSGAARTVKSAQLNAWVGTDDHLLRRLSAALVSADGKIVVDVALSDVNEPQDIAAPATVRQGAPAGAFGELAQGFATGLAGADRGEPVSLGALSSRKPQQAARAVKDGKKVVILFRTPKGLDDRAMTRVMRDVDARTKAFVLTDHVDAVERYGTLVKDLGVSQTPSIVIIDRRGRAQLLEGYLDADTLTQAVVDVR
jgi:hypothetical protein